MDWLLNFTRSGTKEKKLMADQARRLLEVGLWGVPDTAQAKAKLRPGDRVLAYVGAPDKVFIGSATVAAGWHRWTADEARAYPVASSFENGVRLSNCHCWEKPVPLRAVWPRTQGAQSNPAARWYGAVAPLVAADFELIADVGENGHPAEQQSRRAERPSGPAEQSSHRAERPSDPAEQQRRPGERPPAPAQPSVESGSDELFREAERLKLYIGNPASGPKEGLNEDGTRAFFIDKWLAALGYSDFDDIEHGSSAASGDFPDYVLYAKGKKVMVVEAKRIGHRLGAKEAAQVVKYGSVAGVRWGLLTDGRHLQLYDIPATGLEPEDRLVFDIDLGSFADREDFEARTWPLASLLTKEAMQTAEGLERYADRELIRTLLTTDSSATTRTLREELQQRRVLLSPAAIVTLVQELVG